MKNESYQEQTLAYLKGEMNAAEKAAFEEALTTSEELRAELARSRELLDALAAASNEPVTRMVEAIIAQAIQRRASDLHIAPERNRVKVQARVDGHLQELMALPTHIGQAVADRWKVMTNLQISERRVPQDGRVPIRREGKEYDLFVSVMPTLYGERVTVRIIDKSTVFIGLDKLGLSSAQQESLNRLTMRSAGMVLTTGGTGSGKTTFLYSLLRHLQARDTQSKRARNIMTVEDPVEYALPLISQTAVHHEVGLTYGSALRAFLRCDADVVMVGALRDLETLELAAEITITGRLLLSVLPVSSAVGVIQRLREIGLAPFLTAQALAGAVGQRLVRRVCSECLAEYEPAPDDLQKAGLSPIEDGPFRRGAGCAACGHTGFQGRIGLFEVLEIPDRLRPLIAENAPYETLWRETFGRTGGSLWDDARDKVRAGLTTVEEVTWALFDYPRLAPESSIEPNLYPLPRLSGGN